MCGRFALTLPKEAMAQLFDAVPDKLNDPVEPRYNICPTQEVVSVVSHEGARHLVPMRWGFIPRWYKKPADGPLLINARAETIAEKPAFRDACRKRRCLIPASGFYEWTAKAEKGKEPWFIAPRTNRPLVFAGVWQSWQADADSPRLITCAIVTTAANETLAPIHHRMPVTIAPEDYGLWLGEGDGKAASLMRPAEDSFLSAHRVDTAVNSNRVDAPDLIEPLDAES